MAANSHPVAYKNAEKPGDIKNVFRRDFLKASFPLIRAFIKNYQVHGMLIPTHILNRQTLIGVYVFLKAAMRKNIFL